MNFTNIVIIVFLLSAYAGSNVAKSGATEEKFYGAMKTADNNLTAISINFMTNYTNTSKPSMERGVALFTGAAVGLISIATLEATKYGYTNPEVDYRLFAWLMIYFMLLPYLMIFIRPVSRIAGRIIYGL